MRKFAAALVLWLGMATSASAVCTLTTGVLVLEVPQLGDSGAEWAACLQRDLELISIGGGGHFIEDEGVAVVQRATMNFTGAGVSVVDTGSKTIVNIIGAPGDILRSTAVYIGEVTTSNTEWETVAGSTSSLFSELSTFLEAEFHCNLECDSFTSCPVHYALLLDGDFIDDVTTDTATGLQFVNTDGTAIASPEPISFKYRTKSKLNIATHTISILWASSGGVTIRMGRNTNSCMAKYSNDLDTINSGTSANRAGITDFGSQTTLSLQSLVCNVLPCDALNIDNNDHYTATGTLAGQWRNQRTGIGLFE